nr:immunoglobulin heavy chain junction region [Mus musculus]
CARGVYYGSSYGFAYW